MQIFEDIKKRAFKITLPKNQSKGQSKDQSKDQSKENTFKFKSFETGFIKKDWSKDWGEKDGDLFVSKMFKGIYCMVCIYFNSLLPWNWPFKSNYLFVDLQC